MDWWSAPGRVAKELFDGDGSILRSSCSLWYEHQSAFRDLGYNKKKEHHNFQEPRGSLYDVPDFPTDVGGPNIRGLWHYGVKENQSKGCVTCQITEI
jgi:hypothetical protein